MKKIIFLVVFLGSPLLSADNLCTSQLQSNNQALTLKNNVDTLVNSFKNKSLLTLNSQEYNSSQFACDVYNAFMIFGASAQSDDALLRRPFYLLQALSDLSLIQITSETKGANNETKSFFDQLFDLVNKAGFPNNSDFSLTKMGIFNPTNILKAASAAEFNSDQDGWFNLTIKTTCANGCQDPINLKAYGIKIQTEKVQAQVTFSFYIKNDAASIVTRANEVMASVNQNLLGQNTKTFMANRGYISTNSDLNLKPLMMKLSGFSMTGKKALVPISGKPDLFFVFPQEQGADLSNPSPAIFRISGSILRLKGNALVSDK